MSRANRTVFLLAFVGLLLVGLPVGLAVDSDSEGLVATAGIASTGVTSKSLRPSPLLHPSTLVMLGLGLVGLAICQARLKQER